MGMASSVCVAVIDTAVAGATVVLAMRRPALCLAAPRLLRTVPTDRPRRAPVVRSRAGLRCSRSSGSELTHIEARRGVRLCGRQDGASLTQRKERET